MKRSTVLIGWKSYTSEKLRTLWHANSTVTPLTSQIHGDGQPFLMCWSFGSGLASAFTRSAWSVSEVSFSRHMALWLCCTIFFSVWSEYHAWKGIDVRVYPRFVQVLFARSNLCKISGDDGFKGFCVIHFIRRFAFSDRQSLEMDTR